VQTINQLTWGIKMKFTDVSKKVTERFNQLSQHKLFKMDISKDDLWSMYLESFPPGTNEIHKERREYDCQCCAQFVKNIGGVVAIIDGKIETIWDIDIKHPFNVVFSNLSNLVKSAKIRNIFLHTEPKFGQEKTVQTLESGDTINWNHFNCKLPKELVKKDTCQSLLGKTHTNKKVYERGLKELTIESFEIVLDLIAQKSLYKGDEFHHAVNCFYEGKKSFDKITDEKDQDIFVWQTLDYETSLIRNTAIGTLLQDISEGVDITRAVNSFETKVAPTNYKRNSAPITKMMVEKAMAKIESLGLRPSLVRRFATIEDISVNNVIFADRSSSALMKDALADLLMTQTKEPTKNYEKVDEISIADFITNVVPQIDSMELLVQNKHSNNLVSLISPNDESALNLFTWDNKFSWSYNGNITDSIKERVKRAGGNVSGVLRTSLSWFNTDDLDIHVREPNGNHIYYGNKTSHNSSGCLDVDMNVSNLVTDPVENVVWTKQRKIPIGNYKVSVHNYSKRNSSDVGFEIEVEFDNISTVYHYPRMVGSRESVDVLKVNFDGNNFKITNVNPRLETEGKSKEIWSIHTEKFQKVSTMMLSPNFWDGQTIGNKHYMFMLENCMNPDSARGIYNEFLRSDLHEHRKVLEALGHKTQCAASPNQLSGLGFSSTQRSSIICKVKGNFTRTLKINF